MNHISPYEPALSPQMSASVASPKSAKAAREFEASLIASLLASLEKTMGSVPGESEIPGADNYNYLGTKALSEAIAARGGFGIAQLITQYLPKHEGKG